MRILMLTTAPGACGAEPAGTAAGRRYLPSHLSYVPLTGVMTFLLTTVMLFFLGPFDWKIASYQPLALFLISAMTAITMGYAIGVTAPARPGQLLHWRQLFLAGAVSSCVMIFPSAYIYTGKMPWDAVKTVFDQGQAYRDFLARIDEMEGSRGPVVLARTLTNWLIYAVIPLAVFHWKSLDTAMRLLLIGTIMSAASFSLLRGTDQGTFDLGFLFAASAVVAVARWCLKTGRTVGSFVLSKSGLLMIGTAGLFGVFAFNGFVERKIQRYDGNIWDLCIGEQRQLCLNDKHKLSEGLDERGKFAFGMVTSYASQGYYGLALSLNRDFQSTYGVGHSSALTRVYEIATGDRKLYERSFTYRLRNDDWSDLYHWSSMYTWIANDVGFPMTIVVVGFLAWLWGAAWRDAVCGDSDAAGIVFCLLTQTFMYSPANFQLLLGTDTYAALLVWVGLWVYTTRPRQAAS
jgi:hypothetical protein